ncbi:MAG: hypothetical protein MZV64_18180 [Ignavibacteriales bacterium]|nr:hypothetical protein [Ignavibacteriales bacterium]
MPSDRNRRGQVPLRAAGPPRRRTARPCRIDCPATSTRPAAVPATSSSQPTGQRTQVRRSTGRAHSWQATSRSSSTAPPGP